MSVRSWAASCCPARIVAHWLASFGVPEDAIDSARPEALQWALMRGSRSGRVAWQFARDFAGQREDPRP